MGVVCLLLVTGTAVAQLWLTEVRITETLPHGQVDWTDGVVLSRASATGSTRRGAGVATSQAAIQAARQGLLRLFGQVRLDASQMFGPVIAQAEARRQEVEALMAQAAVVETRYLPGGTVETAVQLSFAGRLTALFLPASSAVTPDDAPKTEAVHTGVVIDARGLTSQTTCLANSTPWVQGTGVSLTVSLHAATILLPPGTLTIATTWIIPGSIKRWIAPKPLLRPAAF